MKISVSADKFSEAVKMVKNASPETRDRIWDAAILGEAYVTQEACRTVWREEDPKYPY